MTNLALAAYDRLRAKNRRGSREDSRKLLWESFWVWDYAQMNDQSVWDDDPLRDSLIEADALRKDDAVAGFHKFLSLAEAGSAWAMVKVGYCYEAGRGVVRDAERAEHWYRRSSDAGSTRALLYLGWMLAKKGDLDGAEAVFGRAAADDWAPALFWLAWTRTKRSNSRQVRCRVRPLLERAAAKGSPAAMFALARSMARGDFGVRAVARGLKLLWASYGRFSEIDRRRNATKSSGSVQEAP